MKYRKSFTNKKNTTLYGEFVCSAFDWLPINKQKENAERLEKMTMEDNDTEL